MTILQIKFYPNPAVIENITASAHITSMLILRHLTLLHCMQVTLN